MTPQVLVVGASLGGVVAAHRLASLGCPVLLAAEHPWLGGQFTAQGVPADEHALIDHGGASGSYRAFREQLRAQVRAQPGFRDQARSLEGYGCTNPGDGWVSRLCVEPQAVAAAFEAWLAPLQAAGTLRLLRGVAPVAVRREGRRIAEVTLAEVGDGVAVTAGRDASGPPGPAHAAYPANPARPAHPTAARRHVIQASLVIDATDTGELLRLADLPYRLGKEARSEFGEPDAPDRADPLDQQPVTHVVALRLHAGGSRASPGLAPPDYAFWRDRRVAGWAHRRFSFSAPGAAPGRPLTLPLFAEPPALDWWRYRRVRSAAQWPPGAAEDVSLVNWAQNDFDLAPLLDGPRTPAEVQAAARALSLCLVHWLRTEAPRGDGGCGWPELALAPDALGTPDALAQQVYVRESRRIVARETLTQNELRLAPGEDGARCRPHGHPASVALAWYPMDMHPTCISHQGLNAPVRPFSLPLGSFIPEHVDNLLPGCKNLGVTHLVNACTRVHPAEWAVGEVAGTLAALALEHGLAPAAVHDSPTLTAALRARLHAHGMPLAWDDALLARRHDPNPKATR